MRQILRVCVGLLLLAVYASTAPAWLHELPAIQLLRQVWVQQFAATADDQPMRWRTAEELPPAPLLISSPYDPDARLSTKRDTTWNGYKVHLTETCDADRPNLITDVQTTPATTADVEVTSTVHAALAARELLPATHFVDSAYPDAEILVQSQIQGIDLVGRAVWPSSASRGARTPPWPSPAAGSLTPARSARPTSGPCGGAICGRSATGSPW